MQKNYLIIMNQKKEQINQIMLAGQKNIKLRTEI